MRDKSKQVDGPANPYTESLVVLQVLGDKRGRPLSKLRAALDDIDPQRVEEAIASLQSAGVVVVKRTRIHSSTALRRIDELHMVCI
ncbi:MAG TPA: hypothetical protein VGF95_15135 [Solirubrobacteraceae bacterium]|jgi:hypothetical protein